VSLESYLRAAPKAELHVHLEGSILPATLLTLAQRNGVELPADTVEGLGEWFTFRDFDHFVQIYIAITRCLRTERDYALIAYEFGAEMARQNVRYAEVTFSPSTHHALGVSHDVYFTGLQRGRAQAKSDFGVEMAWVFDIVRGLPEPHCSQRADYTTSVAIECKDDGVISLGLGGAEAVGPPEPFRAWFDKARGAGLHSVPHAGETAGAASVWGAIHALGAERIGHGVRSIEDPALVEHLAGAALPLEVCPMSNLRLGVAPSLAAHPFLALHRAGVPLSINSDDPPLFSTTLSENVALLGQPFALSVTEIDEILLNGVRHSFLPPERKAMLEVAFREELATLKLAHLGPGDL
jgi:aminodeoxyfutalosine deaminase